MFYFEFLECTSICLYTLGRIHPWGSLLIPTLAAMCVCYNYSFIEGGTCHGRYAVVRGQLWETVMFFYYVPGVKLRSAGLVASAFTHWASSPDPDTFFFFFCICVGVLYIQGVQVCACRGQRSTLCRQEVDIVSSSVTLHLIFWYTGSHWTWSSLIWLGWLNNEFRDSSFLALSMGGGSVNSVFRLL